MTNWPTTKLGEVLRLDLDRVPIDASATYPMVGVLSFGRGLFDRETIENGKTSYRFFYRLKPDHIIMSQLFGWEGALALSEERFSGKFVSPQFPTFLCDSAKLDRRFLGWVMRRPKFWEALGSRAVGMGDRRRTLSPDALFACEIPLPSLAEQQRVVVRIEELFSQIKKASALRAEAEEEADALLAAAMSDGCSGKWPSRSANGETAQKLLERVSASKWPGQVEARTRKPMTLPQPPEVPKSWAVIEAGELQERGAILDIQDGNHGSDYPRKSEFAEQGIPFVTAKQFDDGTVRIAEAPRLPYDRAARLRIGFAKPNDVLLTHNASVGDVAIAPVDAGDFLLGTSATYWRCNPEALEPRYLFYFMRSEHFQGQLQFIMKQTTRNQVSVLKQVNLWICLPPLAEQRRIVAELDALQAEVDMLKRLQAETAAELAALLPSILDKAFKGELRP